MKNKYDLLTRNRIDTIIGLKYCEAYDKQYNTTFFKDLYIRYKYAFNGLKETSGTSNKSYQNQQEFLNRFNTLIEDIKQSRTNTELIPVIYQNNEHWMVDGFHRLSILLYFDFDLNLSINNDPMIPPPSQAHNLPLNLNHYNWYPTNIKFFTNKGFSRENADYVMFNFLKNYKKTFSCIVLFPNNKPLSSNIANNIDVIYTKNIDNYTNKFQKNFIELLYFTENWCINGGAINKASACFRNKGSIQILFIEKKELPELRQIKENIRQFYNDRNSIHIPDTQDENNNLLQLLNDNTIDYYNKTQSLYVTFPNFNLYLNKLTDFCKNNNIDTDYICVEGSSILSSYHIRDCGDIDILIDNKYVDLFKNTDFDNHNIYTIKGAKNYFCPFHFEDIIHNPNNHYFFKGIKFCNLSIIKTCKQNRINNKLFNNTSILKDKNDLQNIEKII